MIIPIAIMAAAKPKKYKMYSPSEARAAEGSTAPFWGWLGAATPQPASPETHENQRARPVMRVNTGGRVGACGVGMSGITMSLSLARSHCRPAVLSATAVLMATAYRPACLSQGRQNIVYLGHGLRPPAHRLPRSVSSSPQYCG